MLPRPKRLDRASFGPSASGKRLISAHFSVSYTPSPLGRAAVVVSKKVAKTSVARHLLKRRVTAAIAPYVLPGHTFVVYARAGSPTLSFPALKNELTALLTSLPKV